MSDKNNVTSGADQVMYDEILQKHIYLYSFTTGAMIICILKQLVLQRYLSLLL